ncbi:MFS transporter [Klebsiella sp. NPDC088457]
MVNHSVSLNNKIKKTFILIVIVFFFWGFSHGLLDVLNKHFQDSLDIDKAHSALLQLAYYGAYVFVAIPTGKLMERYGFKSSILTGLSFFAFGSLLFVPATLANTFLSFLIAIFILAMGLGCLETGANSYAASIGSEDETAKRLNLAQTFNGVGLLLGPVVGGSIFFIPSISIGSVDLNPVMLTYVSMAVIVIIFLSYLYFSKLYEPSTKESHNEVNSPCRYPVGKASDLWRLPSFTSALLCVWLQVGALVGIGAFFINFAIENVDVTAKTASMLLSVGLFLFMAGRVVSLIALKYIEANKLLFTYSMMAALACVVILCDIRYVSIVGVYVCYYCMSIQYPSIFAAALSGLGEFKKIATSYLVLGISGGAIYPYLMGMIADITGKTAYSFILPMFSYIVISLYAYTKMNIKKSNNGNIV